MTVNMTENEKKMSDQLLHLHDLRRQRTQLDGAIARGETELLRLVSRLRTEQPAPKKKKRTTTDTETACRFDELEDEITALGHRTTALARRVVELEVAEGERQAG